MLKTRPIIGRSSSLIAAYHLTQYDVPESKRKTWFNECSLQAKKKISLNSIKSNDFPRLWWQKTIIHPVLIQLGNVYVVCLQPCCTTRGNTWMISGKWRRMERYRQTIRLSNKPRTPGGVVDSFSPGTAGSSPVYGHVAFVGSSDQRWNIDFWRKRTWRNNHLYRVITNSLARSELVTYVGQNNHPSVDQASRRKER